LKKLFLLIIIYGFIFGVIFLLFAIFNSGTIIMQVHYLYVKKLFIEGVICGSIIPILYFLKEKIDRKREGASP